MAALGAQKVYDHDERLGYGERCSPANSHDTYLTVVAAATNVACTSRHWCFKADSREMVDRFYQAGIAVGGLCDGEPGIRQTYHPSYYAAFLLDPDGNRIEAVCHQMPA